MNTAVVSLPIEVLVVHCIAYVWFTAPTARRATDNPTPVFLPAIPLNQTRHQIVRSEKQMHAQNLAVRSASKKDLRQHVTLVGASCRKCENDLT